MRPECAGVKDDHSDRCDLYDSEGYCRFYGNSWKDDDGVYRGGEDVELITYCTHRITNGKRINDTSNPLNMKRIPRWNEVIFDGEVRMRCHDLYNPTGIIVWNDGTMHDPKTHKTICADGTVIENDTWEGNLEMRKSFEESMEHMKGFVERKKDDNSTEPHARRIMRSITVDKTHRCWGWHSKHNNVCHLCWVAERCCEESKKRVEKK